MRVLRHNLLLATCLMGLISEASAQTALTVYTAVEPELLPVYKEAFEAKHPDIEITYVRDSAGPITARLKAEQERPRAHVILGLSAIALQTLNDEGLLAPYRPAKADEINPKMRDANFAWFGINAWGGSICVNTDLLQKRGLPIPRSWRDLLKPEYKGQIVMPNPAASSTGYMFMLGWVQGFGEEKGWDYIEALHENILFYTSSGARPAAMVAQGEIPIALTSEAFVRPFMRFNIPVESIEPEEGIAWDAEGCARPKGGTNTEAAEAFLDFCASEEVAQIARDFSGIAAIDAYSSDKGRSIASRFLALDFNRAAKEKAAIIDRFKRLTQK